MKKVLFICVHNSARSQMAEEFLRKYGSEYFEMESAGFKPSNINPLVAQVMLEEGVDLSNKKTQSVAELVRKGKFYGLVVTVCNKALEKECPIFPGNPVRLNWNLENPEDFTGTVEEKLTKTRILRDEIKELVFEFIDNYK